MGFLPLLFLAALGTSLHYACHAENDVQENTSSKGPHDSPAWLFRAARSDPGQLGRSLITLTRRSQSPHSSVLNFNMTSPTSGYVTEPLCEGLHQDCTKDASYTVIVPDEHVTMVSFPVISMHWNWECIRSGFVELLAMNEYGIATRIWKQSSSLSVPPDVYDTSVKVHLVIPRSCYLISGFKMIFSIHPRFQTPPKAGRGVFNCSVPFYDVFKQHLHCNFQDECLSGEDEGRHCGTGSAACQDKMIVGNKCFFQVRRSVLLRWSQARRQCQKRGGDLAVIKTPEEWTAFRHMVKTDDAPSRVYVGMYTYDASMPRIYRDAFVWVDDTVNYRYGSRIRVYSNMYDRICFYYWHPASRLFLEFLNFVSCEEPVLEAFVCQYELPADAHNSSETVVVPLKSVAMMRSNSSALDTDVVDLVQCPNGHVSHAFLSCDPNSHCGTDEYVSQCTVAFHPVPTTHSDTVMFMFSCNDEAESLPYTLLCDFRKDCWDGSDESFCVHDRECQGFTCRSGQCIKKSQQCDVVRDCWDDSDESCTYFFSKHGMVMLLPPPAIIRFPAQGGVSQTVMDSCTSCPLTHFCCSEGYCLPVFCICNGLADCIGREDEAACDAFQCPGHYRCRSSSVCVHAEHLCDGQPQCPQHDDERLCHAECPETCLCHGHAFWCPQAFNVTASPQLRYLDASGSGTQPHDVMELSYLVWLSLSRCGLTRVTRMNFLNLRTLHLNDNQLTSLNLNTFMSLKNLKLLDLSRNPLVNLSSTRSTSQHLELVSVDLSGIEMTTFNSSVLSNYPGVSELNVSHTSMTSISPNGFQAIPNLMSVDLRGSKLQEYPSNLFQVLERLQIIYADNYKLCCQEFLPQDFGESRCIAPRDEVSSCDDLLRSDTYRAFLWIFSVLSLVGNMGCLVTRLLLLKTRSLTAFSIFVTNLSIADLLMGMYLGMVGVADRMYRGKYFWFERTWKSSIPCQIAGFLSLLSSETSAFTICLITLDRFLVLSSPFSEVRFKRKSAGLTCLLVWLLGLTLATVPLLPFTSTWQFYSQTGICIPLPITRRSFGGRNYAFGVIIIFNLVLFLLIATGQAMIYWTIQTTSMSQSSTKKTKDLTIARRLVSVVVSDFLCWFPIGFLGLLAACGTPIPGEVNVGMAIFVLPLNAALNPFLYTFKTLKERWKKMEERQLLKQLEARCQRK